MSAVAATGTFTTADLAVPTVQQVRRGTSRK